MDLDKLIKTLQPNLTVKKDNDRIFYYPKYLNIDTFNKLDYSKFVFDGDQKPHKITDINYVPLYIKPPSYVFSNGGIEEHTNKYYELDNNGIYKMRQVCLCVKEVLNIVSKECKVDVSLDYLDKLVHNEAIKRGCYPSCLGYGGFPKSICISVNEVVCHGIPDMYKLKEGDLVKLDLVLYKDGYHGDSCISVIVGEDINKVGSLIDITKTSLDNAIKICKDEVNISEIGKSIDESLYLSKYSVVREFTGHGVGFNMHMYPSVLHYYTKSKIKLKKNTCITIEPIITENPKLTYWLDDWTTTCKSMVAQFEHTLLIGEDKCEVLT